MPKILTYSILMAVLILTFHNDSFAVDDYAVYSDLIPQIKASGINFPHSAVSTYVIMNTTDVERYSLSCNPEDSVFNQQLSEFPKDLVNSFDTANNQPVKLDAKSFKLLNVTLLTKKKSHAIFTNGGWWPDFYKKYPKSQGTLTLSRVGYSQDAQKALLCYDNIYGGTAGGRAIVLLHYNHGHWIMDKEKILAKY